MTSRTKRMTPKRKAALEEGAALVRILKEDHGWHPDKIADALGLRSNQAVYDYLAQRYNMKPERLEQLRSVIAKVSPDTVSTSAEPTMKTNDGIRTGSLTTLDYLDRMKNGLESIERMAEMAHSNARSLMKPGLQQFKSRITSLKNELEV